MVWGRNVWVNIGMGTTWKDLYISSSCSPKDIQYRKALNNQVNNMTQPVLMLASLYHCLLNAGRMGTLSASDEDGGFTYSMSQPPPYQGWARYWNCCMFLICQQWNKYWAFLMASFLQEINLALVGKLIMLLGIFHLWRASGSFLQEFAYIPGMGLLFLSIGP